MKPTSVTRGLGWLTVAALAMGALGPVDSPAQALSYRDAVLADDPVAYWRLAENSGTLADDTTGGNDATYVGSPALGQSGLVAGQNKAARFGGGDYVAVPDAANINKSLVKRRTIDLWFRADGVTNRQVLVEEGGINRGLSIYINGGRIYFGGWNLTEDGPGTPWGPIFLSKSIQAGRTYHAALVLDGPSGDLEAYLDGARVGSSNAAGNLSGHGSDTGIAARNDATRYHNDTRNGNGSYFHGVIDEVAFYNAALTPANIADHFAAGAGGAGSSYFDALMAHSPDVFWRLDDTGGTAHDVLNQVDGTYHGVPARERSGLTGDPNSAVDFDGNDDYVAVPDSQLLNLGSRSLRTISLWLQPDDVDSRQVVFEEGGQTRGLAIYVDQGQLFVAGWDTAPGGSAEPWGPHFFSTGVTAGKTYNAVLVLDRPSGTLSAYVNGAKIGEGDAGRLTGHGSNVGIGAMRDATLFHTGGASGNGYHFDGVIDEVAVFNSALSPTSVADLYAAGSGFVPPPSARHLVVAAGDIATCSNNNDEKTAALIDDIVAEAALPVTVVPVGDLAYPNGTEQQFANCYDPTWGRHKDITMPVVGNHEYNTPGATGYYDYFGSVAAGPDGYYRYELGAWEVFALNSACGAIGGCDAGSEQLQWLEQQLAASNNACTLAFMHHPRFEEATPFRNLNAMWRELYQDDADLVVSGDAHFFAESYEQDWRGNRNPGGVRQLIAGTGGKSLHELPADPHPNNRVMDNSHFGVIVLELFDGGYEWEFRRVGDGKVMHSGSDTCN